jgi:acyl carrier protein
LDIEEKYNIVIDNESMERMVNVKAFEIIDTKAKLSIYRKTNEK